MNFLAKAAAATAALCAFGAASASQAAVYIAIDTGGGVTQVASFSDGLYDLDLTNVGGFNSVSVEGNTGPSPGLLHSDVVSFNASGPASITLYVTRTGLTTVPQAFRSGLSHNTLSGNATVVESTFADADDGKFGGDLLATKTYTGQLAQSNNFYSYWSDDNGGTYSVTHKYVVTATGGVNTSPTVVLAGVPEPGTWALMIMGFGGAGAMLRRRKMAVA